MENDRWEEREATRQMVRDRMGRLCDPEVMTKDPYYSTQVRLFDQWLQAARMAMEDEGIEAPKIRAVLNRMVYGCPSGAESYERVDVAKQLLDELQRSVRAAVPMAPRCGRLVLEGGAPLLCTLLVDHPGRCRAL